MSASALVLPPFTPPTYHRIVSPTLRIPADPSKPIPVGLLACQRDPLLRELVSTVVSCTIAQSQPTPARKSKKDKSQSAQDPLLEVILHDTILFPEGGGQPHDVGILTSSDGDLWDVVDVKRRGGHAVHYVRVPKDRNVQDALKAFAVGLNVGIALGEKGLERRLDHTCMHTCQHLLSAVLETSLNLPTLAWSLTSHPTPCYVEIPRSMTQSEITLIQNECNRLVFEGRDIHIEVEELDRQTLEVGPSVGIPEDYTGGVKRTVVIDGIDRNPCCGTHFPSIHNLQLFLFPHTETLSGSSRQSTSSARLYFLSGPRLIHYLTQTHTLLTSTSQILSCGAPLVPERVDQVVEERKKLVKRLEDVENELAGTIAKGLVAEITKKIQQGEGAVLYRHRVDDSSNPLGFLSSISTSFTSQPEVSSSSVPRYLIVLSSSPSAQSSNSTTTLMIFSSSDSDSEKKVKAVGDALKTNLGVKGGGKGTKWSGKFTGVWKPGKEGITVEETLKEI